MIRMTVNRFRANLKSCVEEAASNHEIIKVTRRTGESFVVISEEDWERERETLYVLGNTDLMGQIKTSLETHRNGKGYHPSKEELDEINSF